MSLASPLFTGPVTSVRRLQIDYVPLLVDLCAHAQHSPDPSTQNAAVLVDAVAHTILFGTLSVNEFPKKVEYTPERWERPLKYSVIEHAERNAIYNAARLGISTAKKVLVCPWAACSDCARAIIQAGISELITLTPVTTDTHARWDASIDIAMVMLAEARVKVTYVDGPITPEGFSILRNGEPFHP